MNDTETMTAENKKQSRVFQLIWSLILFVGFAVLLFLPNIAPWQGKLDIQNLSLWALILQLFKGQLTGLDTLTTVSYYAFVGFYAVLLICTVASFFVRRKGVIVFNYIKCFVAVAVSALYVYTLMRDIDLNSVFYDKSTYIALNSTVLTMIVGVVGILVDVIAQYRGRGAVKLVSFLLALGTFAFALDRFAFVSGATFESIIHGLTLAEGGIVNTITAIVLRALVSEPSPMRR